MRGEGCEGDEKWGSKGGDTKWGRRAMHIALKPLSAPEDDSWQTRLPCKQCTCRYNVVQPTRQMLSPLSLKLNS